MESASRWIIHVDMDAFYASVEQRDQPELRGLPVIVGGSPGSRGVVAACSYEARRYGVRSAMSSVKAHSLCPDAVFVKPRFDVYRSVSGVIMEIFGENTDLVEPMSLDEAYLDVTHRRGEDPVDIAEKIRKEIRRRTGLTASAGISYNKFLAKVSSDINKPDGVKVITPGMAHDFIGSLPIRKFHGIGEATEKRMLSMGILKGEDLRRYPLDEMKRLFGKSGLYFYDICRGVDRREVRTERRRKSVGRERTFGKDIVSMGVARSMLESIAGDVESRLKKGNLGGKTVTLKVRYSDFSTFTRSRSTTFPVYERSSIYSLGSRLLGVMGTGEGIRLLGLQVSNLVRYGMDSDSRQLTLSAFDEPHESVKTD